MNLFLSFSARFFSTSLSQCSKRAALRKPNISTLTKHLKPDGLNGRERRDLLRNKLKTTKKSASGGPYIPVKRRLEEIAPIKKISTSEQFEDLELSESVIQAVRQILPNCKPTEIQALAIPQLLDRRRRHILVAAETGSGKTLAYLLPTVELLKQDEKNIDRRPYRPRALVLVPTRELIQQVVRTAKSLSHIVKLRVVGMEGKNKASLEDGPVDLVVSTPTSIALSIRNGLISLSDTKYLVIDEADSMFDKGWGEDCEQIIRRLREKNEDEKIIIVSATLPRSVNKTLDKLFPHMTKITTPSLHRSLPNLKQSFVDLDRFQGNRQLALLEILKKNIKDKKTLIFCNTRKSAELLHKFLESKHQKTLVLYKDAPMDRKEALELFEQDPSYKMLISTDIASRGIDTTFVDHVVLFDFPTSVIDYLHRVGRTARAGQTGKATSLIGRKDRMMADRIKRAIHEATVMT